MTTLNEICARRTLELAGNIRRDAKAYLGSQYQRFKNDPSDDNFDDLVRAMSDYQKRMARADEQLALYRTILKEIDGCPIHSTEGVTCIIPVEAIDGD